LYLFHEPFPRPLLIEMRFCFFLYIPKSKVKIFSYKLLKILKLYLFGFYFSYFRSFVYTLRIQES
jgi:hypothetical protein